MLRFEGIHNFRDYGGYAIAGGGRLRAGRLFRSAQHRGATPRDLDRLASLGLAGVIDLRGGAERAAAPCPRPDGFTAEILFVEENTAGLAPHVAAAAGAPSASEAHAAMLRGYAEMPFRPRLLPILARYFDALARIDGPTLIHCMAGKDRTGLAVALLHAMAGVAWDDILADYLLTNVAGRVEERIESGARHIRAAYGEAIGEDAIRTLMTCDPAYLEAAFATIRERHGSVETYLEVVLGVDAALRTAILGRVSA